MNSLFRLRPRLVVGTLVVGIAALVVNACSGKTQESSATRSDAGGTDGGPSGQNHPDCPAAAPGEEPCTKDGLLCEYGDDFNPQCNTVRVCSGARWASPLLGGGGKCPSEPPTIAANSAECPATRAALQEGQACRAGGDAGGTTCAYDGSLCTCGAFCPSYPIQRPDCEPDAGRTNNCCDRTKIAWNCFDGPAFCKTPRPRVGSACTKDGEECALAKPVECGQPKLRCANGRWEVEDVPCPVSTARAKRDVAYVDREEADRLHDQLMSTRLATYRYKSPAPNGMGGSEAQHLGFIIEDMPEGSPAVMPSRERVDIYGYASMTVASLQHQQREIEALKAEMARLREENASMRRALSR